MPLKLNGATSGYVQLDAPAVAGTTAITVPAISGTIIVADSNGNVGIGTASPISKLQVSGGADSTIRNTASSGSSWFVGSNTSAYMLHNESNTPMVFTTNGTERMRIDASGRVTTPSQPHVRVTAYTGANYSLSAGDNGPLPFNLIQYQIGTNYNNTASNYKFTCPVAGVYQITASVELAGSSATYTNLFIRVNGSTQAGTFQTGYNSAYQTVSTNASIYCSANDYLQIYMNSNITSGVLEFSANDFRNHLTITLLG
jgi:hypothetical protein